MLARNVNDNACCLSERVVLEFFASKLAPTLGLHQSCEVARACDAATQSACLLLTPQNTVGASLLAKNVNDNACCLSERVVLEFFASKLVPTLGLYQSCEVARACDAAT